MTARPVPEERYRLLRNGEIKPMLRWEFTATADGRMEVVIVEARTLLAAMVLAKRRIDARFARRGEPKPTDVHLGEVHVLARAAAQPKGEHDGGEA